MGSKPVTVRAPSSRTVIPLTGWRGSQPTFRLPWRVVVLLVALSSKSGFARRSVPRKLALSRSGRRRLSGSCLPFSRFLYDLEKVLVNLVLAHVRCYSAVVTCALETVGSWHRSLCRWVNTILSAIPFFRVDVVVCWTWLQRVYQGEAFVGDGLLDHLLEMSSIVRITAGDEGEA